MSKLKYIYNASECREEEAEVQTCHRCGGTGIDHGYPCTYCKGHGRLWVAPSTWSEPLWRPGDGRYCSNLRYVPKRRTTPYDKFERTYNKRKESL